MPLAAASLLPLLRHTPPLLTPCQRHFHMPITPLPFFMLDDAALLLSWRHMLLPALHTPARALRALLLLLLPFIRCYYATLRYVVDTLRLPMPLIALHACYYIDAVTLCAI